MTAALGVVLNPNQNTQKFFGGSIVSSKKKFKCLEHIDDILCLDISDDRNFVATGEVGPQPNIFVWNTQNCQLKSN